MKKLYVINGVNSELAQFFIKKIIKKNFILGFYKKKYSGITNKNIIVFDKNFNKKKITQIICKYKKIVFVSFAAKRDEALVVNLEEKKINEVLESNIFSSLKIIKIILPVMIQNKFGRIIFLSSKKAEHGSAGNILYSFCKTGLQGISRTLAKEYSQFNITSNVISLGYFNTKMWKSLNSKLKKKLLENTLSKKLGNPNALTDLIRLIVNNSFINFAKINIDGGIL